MLKRTGTVVAAAAVAALALPADAQAAAVACGGSVSTQGITGNGCISAERWKDGHVFMRNITAHTVLTNTRPHASWVEYEAYFRVVSGGHWVKIGNGRTVVQRRSTVGPIAIGSTDRVCGPVNVKVEIRVHVRPARVPGPTGAAQRPPSARPDAARPDAARPEPRHTRCPRLRDQEDGGSRVPAAKSVRPVFTADGRGDRGRP